MLWSPHAGTVRLSLRNASDTVAQYASLITPTMKAVIQGQRFDGLFINQKGGMYGNGQMWFGGVCLDAKCATHDVLITAITVK